MKRVMCAGTFNVIHPGHLYYLSEAKKLGDYLIVVVARDKTSERFKHKKPTYNEHQRLSIIQSLKIVDEALLGNEGGIFNIIKQIKPDVICLGYDQNVSEKLVEQELIKLGLKAQVVRIDAFNPEIYKSSRLSK